MTHKQMASQRLRRNTLVGSLLIVGSLLVGGCAETELVAHVVKSGAQVDGGNPGGTVKVGRPYTINGVRYVPRVDNAYDETGLASWYGADFHGKRTANGEIYDMNALTAAHKTLPMPSRVRVTNLENGRSLELTVNDRGPFVRGRIIDVSRRAAEALGFRRQGVAEVRVQVLGAPAPATQVVTTTPLPAPMPAAPEPEPVERSFSLISSAVAAEPESVVNARLYVQGGAFVSQANAVKLGERLSPFGPTSITAVESSGRLLYRVRLGPIYNRETAGRLLAQVVAAGHSEARIVAD
jgi:rare lipoprotein A